MIEEIFKLFGINYSKSKDGTEYDIYLLKLLNTSTNENITITQYGNSKQEIEDFWKHYNEKLGYKLLECTFYKKGKDK